MQSAPLPDNEDERLEALRRLLCLDTLPEERFDRIVQFAAEEFDVPTALISLVDSKRQWFKARVGMDLCETSRDVSFCAHAILSHEPLVIPDATLDPRFADNPLVTGPPGIRFYAGAPLELKDGSRVGSLCVIDYTPREIDPLDLAILTTLSKLAVRELENDHEITPPAG